MSKDITLIVTDRYGDRLSFLPKATLLPTTWELLEPGSFSVSIDPLAEGADEILLVEREIQVWLDNDIIHWGVPWTMGGDSRKITFQCDGVLSLFRKRFIDDASMDYDSIDQFSIAWDLLSYAQSEATQANRDLNISSSGFVASGVPRSPRYDRDEHANILDLIREFPEMNDGFEYSIVLDPTGTQRFWTPHYPRKGSLKAEYHMRWDKEKARRTISSFTVAEDGDKILTHGYVTGGSSGDVKFEQNYENVAASAKFGVMQGVISDGNQKDVGWLYDRAVKEVNSRDHILIQTQISSVTSEDLELGDVVEGDWLPVTIDYGRIQADAFYRVKTVTFDPLTEKITFGFDGEVVAA